ARCGGLWRPFRVFVHERRWLLARYRLPSFRQRMAGHNSSPSPCDNNDAEREVRVIRVGWPMLEYFSYSNLWRGTETSFKGGGGGAVATHPIYSQHSPPPHITS